MRHSPANLAIKIVDRSKYQREVVYPEEAQASGENRFLR